ncbi:hypothetical protein ACSCB1_03335 [Streptomyces europaeiscabiei]|uniref:hypothetical protein n=1 Tax=Streptomyces europaeiscabiei TaxID=146819 RepID=UPI0006285F92|nr:hypothetical protein [Streptomyces europaeiscabiei]MDX3672266.1 hypothetical protein [Streptomyces europaeiscabiei]MDX3778355.1 hypothetical protein [Streptomyces europaeiscabiei]MDX3833268.1 hypothetical protein [Streptomyces europaeiscabiei]MDX3847256.1 hypothetical protein [Streptomyces europaeiscabiei]
MGRFTKRVGSFDSPHSVEDTLEVLFNGVAEQLSTPSPTVSMPGVEAAVYLSRFDTTGVTVAAGNKIDTYFTFYVDLTPTTSGCVGEAYFDRRMGAINRWMGNAMGLTGGLSLVFQRCSVRTRGWTIA